MSEQSLSNIIRMRAATPRRTSRFFEQARQQARRLHRTAAGESRMHETCSGEAWRYYTRRTVRDLPRRYAIIRFSEVGG